jgi:hypothetical protein
MVHAASVLSPAKPTIIDETSALACIRVTLAIDRRQICARGNQRQARLSAGFHTSLPTVGRKTR